ncbi:MAG: hypothetical protein ABJB17_05155 [Burkholderiales bacterium]
MRPNTSLAVGIDGSVAAAGGIAGVEGAAATGAAATACAGGRGEHAAVHSAIAAMAQPTADRRGIEWLRSSALR